MNSRMMTILGALTAALGFASANLPDGTPDWLKLLMGSMLAALAVSGGYSHPGTAKKREQEGGTR